MIYFQIAVAAVGLVVVAGPWLLSKVKGMLPQPGTPNPIAPPDHDLLAELVHLRTCMKSAPEAVAAIDQTLIPAAVKMLSEPQK